MNNNIENTKDSITKDTTTKEVNTQYYTVFNYKMAKYLLKHGCAIADISLNKKVKGIVFHFVHTENLEKLIELKKEIIKLQRGIKDITENIITDTNTISDNNTIGDSNTTEEIINKNN